MGWPALLLVPPVSFADCIGCQCLRVRFWAPVVQIIVVFFIWHNSCVKACSARADRPRRRLNRIRTTARSARAKFMPFIRVVRTPCWAMVQLGFYRRKSISASSLGLSHERVAKWPAWIFEFKLRVARRESKQSSGLMASTQRLAETMIG